MGGAAGEASLRLCNVGGAGKDALSAERRSPPVDANCRCAARAGPEGSAFSGESVRRGVGRVRALPQ